MTTKPSNAFIDRGIYDGPFDAFTNYMNILGDFISRVRSLYGGIENETKLNQRISFIGESEGAKYLDMSTDIIPRLLLNYKVSEAGNSFPDDEINVEEFIGIKSYKAKGKRLSTREIESFSWLEPIEPEVPDDTPENEDLSVETEENKSEETAVNPADVPLEIEDTSGDERKSGDGEQMELNLF